MTKPTLNNPRQRGETEQSSFSHGVKGFGVGDPSFSPLTSFTSSEIKFKFNYPAPKKSFAERLVDELNNGGMK